MRGNEMREKTIEHRLVQLAKAAGGWALKFTSPGNSGVPDRLEGGFFHIRTNRRRTTIQKDLTQRV